MFRYLILLVLCWTLAACSRFDSAALPQSATSTNTTSRPPVPDVQIVRQNEGDSGVTDMVFVITLNLASDNDVVVDYFTEDLQTGQGFDVAVGAVGIDPSADYTPASGTLVIPAGSTRGTIPVQILSDTVVEKDEAFGLRLKVTWRDGNNTVIIPDATVAGVILNDDNVPVANPDTLQVVVDSGLTNVNVRANDTQDVPARLVVTDVSTAGSGTVAVNADELSIDYTPATGFFGKEIVTYIITDEFGHTASGLLTVTVLEPKISILPAFAAEGDTGSNRMIFTVELNNPVVNDVTVDYASSDDTATVADGDYVATSGTVTVPGGSTRASFPVVINGDVRLEPPETFTMTLSNVSLGTLIDVASAKGLIVHGLNDTGVTTCGGVDGSGNAANNLPCPQVSYPGQDGEAGRDKALTAETQAKIKGGQGRVGFDFTKIGSQGQDLTDIAAVWDCVRDEVTGLWWEVKTSDPVPGLRDAVHDYSWLNSSGINDGGDPGQSNGGNCFDAVNCDTEKFIIQVNAAGLCGFNDWRLPTKNELSTLIDYGISAPGPAIDTRYFPNTATSVYWTATPSGGNVKYAWYFVFADGTGGVFPKIGGHKVRLVRGRI